MQCEIVCEIFQIQCNKGAQYTVKGISSAQIRSYSSLHFHISHSERCHLILLSLATVIIGLENFMP